MKNAVQTFDDLFAEFGGIGAVADAIDVPYVNAQVMKHRRSIPVDHWGKLIEAEQGQRLGLDWPVLMDIRDRSKQGASA